jgi:hypothetical protein
MLVKLNGEFFAKHRAPVDFRSAKKFDEIDPCCDLIWQVPFTSVMYKYRLLLVSFGCLIKLESSVFDKLELL